MSMNASFAQDVIEIIAQRRNVVQEVLPEFALYPKLQRQICVSSLKEACGLSGVSTLFRIEVAREGSTVWQTTHHGLRLVRALLPRTWRDQWKQHVNDSPLKPAIVSTSSQSPVGFADRRSLVSDDEWYGHKMGLITSKLSVLKLEYLWVRLSASELWVFGLRSFRHPRMSEEERARICLDFGQELLACRDAWWLPAANLLSDSEQRTLWAKSRLDGVSNSRLADYLDRNVRSYGESQAGSRLRKANVDRYLAEIATKLDCVPSEAPDRIRELSRRREEWFGTQRREFETQADGELERFVRQGLKTRLADDGQHT